MEECFEEMGKGKGKEMAEDITDKTKKTAEKVFEMVK